MKVESGYRLPPPLGSPSTIGKVMTKCWLVPGTPGSTHYVYHSIVCACDAVCVYVCSVEKMRIHVNKINHSEYTLFL